MASLDVNNSLKEASLETLRSILSANQEVRKAGESQIQALEVTEGLSQCVFLYEITEIVTFNNKSLFLNRVWNPSDRNLTGSKTSLACTATSYSSTETVC